MMTEANSILDIPVQRIDGTPASLGEHKGKVMLVVNVASKCGLTKQYEGLEGLYREFREHGLVVCGFPANDFAGQEPGTDAEIQQFCRGTFGVEFPMYSKIGVTGQGKHPLYKALVAAQPEASGNPDAFRKELSGYGIKTTEAPEILWNFEKFLVDRNGRVAARFAPNVEPNEPALRSAIEAELARS